MTGHVFRSLQGLSEQANSPQALVDLVFSIQALVFKALVPRWFVAGYVVHALPEF